MLWVSANKLTINIDKTHCISFRNDIQFEIVIENKHLIQVSETKFLWHLLDYKNVSFCLKGISPWDGHFIELTCIEVGNSQPTFIGCFEKYLP